jgi:hypothetical protein
MINRLAAIRRILATLLLALWWGGFTFYAGRVVFIGHEILRSKIRQGFITERVTTELNWFAVVALVVVGWEMFASKMFPHRKAIWTAWGATTIATGALFLLHIKLAGMFDFAARQVADADHFYSWHRLYLCIATVQWLAGSAMLVFFHLFLCPRTITKANAG